MVLVDAETGDEAEPVVVDRSTGRRVDGPDFVFTAAPPRASPSGTATASRPPLTKPRRTARTSSARR